ncbi:MAG: FAD:protein FMN transferase [Candidatus Nanoarchaeia archaeon]
MKFKTYSFKLLGTTIFIQLPESLEATQQLVQECYQECLRIDEWYSRFRKDYNTLQMLNEIIGEWQEVDDEVLYLFTKAKEYEKNTDNSFSLNTKEILESWGYNQEYQLEKGLKNKSPDGEEYAVDTIIGKKNKSQFSFQSFEIDEEDSSIKLHAPIEFGGLGKGYAIDCIVEICREYTQSFLINAGGDLFASHEDINKGFEILLEDPKDSTKHIGKIVVNNFALASSSSNRRAWGEFHHIVNPQTQQSANEMIATYVQSNTAIDADAYATALFAQGFEKAKQSAQEIEEIEVLLISNTHQVWKTKNFKAQLFTTDTK